MKLIAFNGGMGTGKSTAISAVGEALGRPVCLVKFAGPLYHMQELIYNRIESVYQRPKNFVKDRKLLQWLGTDWGRGSISDTIWVDLWRAEVTALRMTMTNPVIVCDDVRFDNEANTVHSMGGVVVRLTRPSNTAHAQGGEGIANHASEAGISPALVDYTIANDGTEQEFRDKVKDVLKAIMSSNSVATENKENE